jgi:hypothetical protein
LGRQTAAASHLSAPPVSAAPHALPSRYYDRASVAHAVDGEQRRAHLLTAAAFGCVQWDHSASGWGDERAATAGPIAPGS